MRFNRKLLLWALSYTVAGMALGIVMAASHDHAQPVTHAHALLVGFVVSSSMPSFTSFGSTSLRLRSPGFSSSLIKLARSP